MTFFTVFFYGRLRKAKKIYTLSGHGWVPKMTDNKLKKILVWNNCIFLTS